jgi:adenylate kinase
MILAITGVPGTGKTALSRMLSEKTGWPVVGANGIVEEKKLWSRKEEGAKVVDMKRLEKALAKITKSKKNLILEGHLLCDLKVKANCIVVLRTRPDVLRKRLETRGYPKKKTDENVLAEALDYCTIEAERRYKKVYEIDTTKSFRKAILGLHLVSMGKGEGFRSGKISWGRELENEVRMNK